MKGKILLVSLYGNLNYGNVLQRYALTKTFEGFGFEVHHLCEHMRGVLLFRLTRRPKRIIKHILALMGVKKYRIIMKKSAREERFKSFQDKFTETKIFMTFTEALTANKSTWAGYDFVVVGSDQVWHNWKKIPQELEYYYLEFIEREKRVNYAPSFGFSHFDDDDKELHRKGLEGFKRVSCREQEMQPMIRTLTGQEAELVLDPTLLLVAEQWREVSSRPEYDLPERYVLCYFLGNITPEYSQAISDMAGGLPVISIYANYSEESMKDYPHYLTHPGEFVYLIEHADFVCTDSFHGTAFSVIFRKNFLAFRRAQKNMNDMFGRIESILSNLGLMNHVYNPGMTTRPNTLNNEAVTSRLDEMRDSSLKYLRECLKV